MRTIILPHAGNRSIGLLTAKLLMPLLLLGCGIEEETPAKEFGVVTAEHGYITDEGGQVLETLDTFGVVDILEDVDGVLVVKSEKSKKGRMTVEQVHRSSWFELITPENSPQIRKALRQIETAHSRAVGKLPPVEQMQAGLSSLEAAIGRDNTGYAWVLSYLSIMQIEDGDPEAAKATLEQSRKIFEDLDAFKSLHAADFYNTRALIAQNQSDYDAAIADYQKAIEISNEFLGDNHADLRVVHANLASAYYEKGETDQAIEHQLKAQSMGVKIHPADVVERIADNRNLALYLTTARRFEEAKTQLLEARVMLEASPSPDLRSMFDTAIDLGQCYYELDDNAVARRRLEEVVVLLNENKSLEQFTDLESAPLLVRAHMLLGLIETYAGRDEVSLEHHEKAISFSSPENPDANAARAAQEAGDVAKRLDRIDDARKSYKLSIAIYTALEGDEGENVAAVTELLAALDGETPTPKPSGEESTRYVLVTGTQGFLTDAKETVVAIVPGFTLLEVAGKTDDSFYVRHEGKELLIRKALVRSGNLLPSHGVMSEEDAKPFYDKLAKARQLQHDGDLPAAHGAMIATIDELSKQVGVDNPFYVLISCSIAICATQQGGLDMAEQILDRQADYIQQLDKEGHPVIIDVLATLSYVRLFEQRYDESASLMQKAIELQKLNGLQNSAEFAIPESIMIGIDFQRADFKSALKRQEAVMEIISRSYPRQSIDYAEALLTLGMAQLMNDPQGKVIDLMAEAVRIANTVPKPEDRVVGLKQSYGLFLKFTGKSAEAKPYLQEALKELRGRDRFLELSMKLNTITELADIAASEGQHREAIKLGEEGIAVVNAAHKQYSVAPKITGEIAERLHDILIVSYENAGDSRNAKKYSDLLVKLKANNATLKTQAAASESTAMAKDAPSNDLPSQNTSPAPAPVKSSGSTSADPFNLLPSHEFMIVTTQATSLHDVPNGQVIAPIGKNRKLWSLESASGWSRVRIPGKDGFGWLNQQHAAELNETLMQTMLQERLTEATEQNLDAEAITNKAAEVMAQFQQAQQLSAASDFAGAVSKFETALSGSREVLGEDNPLSAMLNTELVGAYVSSKQFSRARALLETTQPITRKTFGDNHPRVAVDAWRMANLLSLLADFRGASEQLQKAIKVAETSYGKEDVRTHMLRSDLAQILMQQGQLDQAETILKEIVSVLEADAATPNPLRASALRSLASIAFDRESFLESLDRAAKAEREFTALGESFRPNRGQAKMYRGMSAFRLGTHDDAAEILASAVEDLSAGGATNPLLRIEILRTQGLTEFLRGDTEKSQGLMDEALVESERYFGEDHINTARIRTQRATVLMAREDFIPALNTVHIARAGVLEYVDRTLADLPVKEQTAFLRLQDKRDLERSLSMAFVPQAQPFAARRTATWLLNARNLPHELSARSGQIRRLLKSREHLAAYERYRAARERLATMPTGSADGEEKTFRDEEIAKQKELMDSALKSLPLDVQQQIGLQTMNFVDNEDVRQTLQDDETLVEIIRMRPVGFTPEDVRRDLTAETRQPEQYVAWVMPPYRKEAEDDAEIVVIRLGNADEIDAKIAKVQQEMLKSIQTINDNGHAKATQETLAVCQTLSDAVWKPIENVLGGRKKVILSPDGELWRAPWTAFPIGNDRLLIEDYELRLVVSGRELLQKKPTNLALSAPVILADPDYDASESALRNALRALFPGNVRQPRPSVNLETDSVRASLTQRAARLPGTAIEAKAVLADVRKLSSQEPSVLMQAQASEDTFRRTERPYSVMFSTHGFFLPQEKLRESNFADSLGASPGSAASLGDAADPLMRCGLLLAGCNQRGIRNSSSDGILLGREIVEIDLRGTKLVVLSACETGLGDVADGQGIAGLRQAFQLAGAESVVSTLWSIEDKETARLMVEFYSQLSSGQSKPAALRQAQLNRIAALRERNGAAHPFFWAAFTLTGEK